MVRGPSGDRKMTFVSEKLVSLVLAFGVSAVSFNAYII